MATSKKSLKKNSQPPYKTLKSEVQNRTRQAFVLVGTTEAQGPILFQLNRFLANHLKPEATLLLALSGGLDSCVLLHLLAALKQTIPFHLYAMHVHHGLSANADAWADFCVAQCRELNLPLEVVHVNVEKNSKLGIEATARKLRYEALFNYTINNTIDNTQPDFIVTAHHQDDQAETLLLQLLRGAGIKGLASMATIDKSRRLLRPLLNVSRSALQDYAKQHGITWCDDESNENTEFERNFVRHEVLPVVQARYPAIKTVLARTASHLAEANDLLDTLAKIDAESILKENKLCLQGLSALDTPRAKNLLRWWFAKNHLAMPSAEHLSEIVEQLLNAKVDANVSIQLHLNNQAQYLTLKRYQQNAYLIQTQKTQPFDLAWNGEPLLALPNGGYLQFKQVIGTGLALKFGMDKLRIANRDGGERFKPNVLRPTRTLKHLLQEANIPPWRRDNLPLIYWHDTLAFVPDIGVAHELQAAENEPGLEIVWHNPPL
jgi:tRNA(Ile)-lysidine synthase